MSVGNEKGARKRQKEKEKGGDTDETDGWKRILS